MMKVSPSEHREILASSLPLSIRLESREVAAWQPPSPFFVFTYRNSYLPQMVQRVHDHFKSYLQPSYGQQFEPWFEYEGITLDWRLPIGVLFDIFCGDFLEPELPWSLIVHFHDAPSDCQPMNSYNQRARWGAFESLFINNLKQSTYILHGSASRFQELRKTEELSLIDSIRTGRFELFWDVAERLRITGNEVVHKFPIRLHIWGPPYMEILSGFPATLQSAYSEVQLNPNAISTENESQKTLNVSGTGEPTSSLSLEASSGTPSLLGNFLHAYLPSIFPLKSDMKFNSTSHPTSHSAESCTSTSVSQIQECPSLKPSHQSITHNEGEDGIWMKRGQVLILGVEVPLITPLHWLAANVAMLDQFIHVTVRLSPELVQNSRKDFTEID